MLCSTSWPSANKSDRQGALLLCQWWWMFGMSKWCRMRPRKNKRTKTWLQRKRKKQPKQLSYIINPQPRWIWAPTWFPYDTRDPRLCRECDGFRETLCVCLERSCVQLQLNRTSVGCSQARSERLRTGTKKQSQWQISTVLIRGARVQFHNFPEFLLSPDSYVYTHAKRCSLAFGLAAVMHALKNCCYC